MYRKPPPIITADILEDLVRKVESARLQQAQVPVGKVERYADNRVKGYYQVMVWAQITMFEP